jgi:hypothetical protein
MKPYEVRFASLIAAPPERQLSPPHGQLTSLIARVSRQLPLFEEKRGEITIVFWIASARNAAARAVRK